MLKYKIMRKIKYYWIFIAFLVIPLLHFFLNCLLNIQFRTILNGEIIKLGNIKVENKHKVELLGIYGNVFDPKKYNHNIDFDLVPVTCTIDPISLSKNVIIWEYNDLLKSALINTFVDSVIFKKTVDELITTMSANGELIKYFLFTPPSSYTIEEYDLRQWLKIYFFNISKKTKFYERTRIQKIGVLPIFYPRKIEKLNVRKKRLKDNRIN